MNKILTLLFTLISMVVFGQQTFTLQQAIEYALENNSSMRIAEIESESADAKIMEFKSIGMPKLNAGINYQYYFAIPANPVEDFITPTVYQVLEEEMVAGVDPYVGPPDIFEFSFFQRNNLSASIDGSVLLFDGSYLEGLKAARLFKDLTQKSIDVKEEQIRSAVTKAYMNILIVEENKAVLDKNISNIEKSLKDVQAYYDNGFLEQLDVDRLNLSLLDVSTERQKIEQLINSSYDLLKFQMSYPLDGEITITEDLKLLVEKLSVENVDLEEPIDYSKRPEYDQILLGRDLNEVNVAQLKKGYLPSVMARANFNELLQRNNLFDNTQSGWIPTASVSLGINIPIYDGNEKKSKIKQAKLDLEEIDIQQSEFERSLNLQVRQARIQYNNAKTNLTNREKTLTIIENIYDKTLIKFREGVGSSLEVTQAETSLFDMQSKYINALYDLLITKTDLDIALGNL